MGFVTPYRRIYSRRAAIQLAKPRRSAPSALALLIVILLCGAAYLALWNMGQSFARPPATEAVSISKTPRIGTCNYILRDNCVIDGDTFYFAGEKIRVADIDAPETGGAKCASEAELGARATSRLRALLNDGPFDLRGYQGRDLDRYGRKLRVVMRDGKSIGDILIAEGLARRWNGKRRPWCI